MAKAAILNIYPLLKTNPMDLNEGTDNHVSSDWEIRLNDLNKTLVWSSINDTENLEQIQIPWEEALNYNIEYVFRVRHNSENYGSSAWAESIRVITDGVETGYRIQIFSPEMGSVTEYGQLITVYGAVTNIADQDIELDILLTISDLDTEQVLIEEVMTNLFISAGQTRHITFEDIEGTDTLPSADYTIQLSGGTYVVEAIERDDVQIVVGGGAETLTLYISTTEGELITLHDGEEEEEGDLYFEHYVEDGIITSMHIYNDTWTTVSGDLTYDRELLYKTEEDNDFYDTEGVLVKSISIPAGDFYNLPLSDIENAHPVPHSDDVYYGMYHYYYEVTFYFLELTHIAHYKGTF